MSKSYSQKSLTTSFEGLKKMNLSDIIHNLHNFSEFIRRSIGNDEEFLLTKCLNAERIFKRTNTNQSPIIGEYGIITNDQDWITVHENHWYVWDKQSKKNISSGEGVESFLAYSLRNIDADERIRFYIGLRHLVKKIYSPQFGLNIVKSYIDANKTIKGFDVFRTVLDELENFIPPRMIIEHAEYADLVGFLTRLDTTKATSGIPAIKFIPQEEPNKQEYWMFEIAGEKVNFPIPKRTDTPLTILENFLKKCCEHTNENPDTLRGKIWRLYQIYNRKLINGQFHQYEREHAKLSLSNTTPYDIDSQINQKVINVDYVFEPTSGVAVASMNPKTEQQVVIHFDESRMLPQSPYFDFKELINEGMDTLNKNLQGQKFQVDYERLAEDLDYFVKRQKEEVQRRTEGSFKGECFVKYNPNKYQHWHIAYPVYFDQKEGYQVVEMELDHLSFPATFLGLLQNSYPSIKQNDQTESNYLISNFTEKLNLAVLRSVANGINTEQFVQAMLSRGELVYGGEKNRYLSREDKLHMNIFVHNEKNGKRHWSDYACSGAYGDNGYTLFLHMNESPLAGGSMREHLNKLKQEAIQARENNNIQQSNALWTQLYKAEEKYLKTFYDFIANGQVPQITRQHHSQQGVNKHFREKDLFNMYKAQEISNISRSNPDLNCFYQALDARGISRETQDWVIEKGSLSFGYFDRKINNETPYNLVSRDTPWNHSLGERVFIFNPHNPESCWQGLRGIDKENGFKGNSQYSQTDNPGELFKVHTKKNFDPNSPLSSGKQIYALTEGAFSAMSYADLHPDHDVLALGGVKGYDNLAYLISTHFYYMTMYGLIEFVAAMDNTVKNTIGYSSAAEEAKENFFKKIKETNFLVVKEFHGEDIEGLKEQFKTAYANGTMVSVVPFIQKIFEFVEAEGKERGFEFGEMPNKNERATKAHQIFMEHFHSTALPFNERFENALKEAVYYSNLESIGAVRLATPSVKDERGVRYYSDWNDLVVEEAKYLREANTPYSQKIVTQEKLKRIRSILNTDPNKPNNRELTRNQYAENRITLEM